MADDNRALADELERRLHEQVSRNAELDVELRYLQAELRIREEYINSLEEELEEAGSVIGRQQLTLAEDAAYRNRVSHRTVDTMIVFIRRSPRLYRVTRRAARTVLRRPPAVGAP